MRRGALLNLSLMAIFFLISCQGKAKNKIISGSDADGVFSDMAAAHAQADAWKVFSTVLAEVAGYIDPASAAPPAVNRTFPQDWNSNDGKTFNTTVPVLLASGETFSGLRQMTATRGGVDVAPDAPRDGWRFHFAGNAGFGNTINADYTITENADGTLTVNGTVRGTSGGVPFTERYTDLVYSNWNNTVMPISGLRTWSGGSNATGTCMAQERFSATAGTGQMLCSGFVNSIYTINQVGNTGIMAFVDRWGGNLLDMNRFRQGNGGGGGGGTNVNTWDGFFDINGWVVTPAPGVTQNTSQAVSGSFSCNSGQCSDGVYDWFRGTVTASGAYTGVYKLCESCSNMTMTGQFSLTQTFVISGGSGNYSANFNCRKRRRGATRAVYAIGS